MKRYMVGSIQPHDLLMLTDRHKMAYAKCHIDWAKKNVETWREAKEEVEKIEVR